MTQSLKKIWGYRWALRSIISTIYFNFHYLPLRQAVKLPILLNRPKFIALKGRVVIDGPVKFGMIQLGRRRVCIYPDTGVTWENRGGTLVFKGRAYFGNDTYLSIGPMAQVEFGNLTTGSAGMKFVSVERVTTGEKVIFGWGCLLTDTSFHPVIRVADGSFSPAARAIAIGDRCWFATRCNILPGVEVPEGCLFSAGTTVTRGMTLIPRRTHRHGGGLEVGTVEVYHDIHGEHDK